MLDSWKIPIWYIVILENPNISPENWNPENFSYLENSNNRIYWNPVKCKYSNIFSDIIGVLEHWNSGILENFNMNPMESWEIPHLPLYPEEILGYWNHGKFSKFHINSNIFSGHIGILEYWNPTKFQYTKHWNISNLENSNILIFPEEILEY